MLPADHPLADLQARAALAMGWPVLVLAAPTEPEAMAALQAIEAARGPCPQADLIEPFHAGDPYTLRIALPGLEPAGWAAIQAALAASLPAAARPSDGAADRGTARDAAPPCAAALVPGAPPGTTEAIDQQVIVADVIAAEPLPATLWSDPDGGGLLVPDLAEEDPDPPGAALASEIVGELAAVDPSLARDPAGVIAFAHHRATGRRAIRVAIPATTLDPLPGDALHALRRDVVAAIGRVVARREGSADKLAPDLLWDPRFGFAVTAWRIAPNADALPADAPVGPGLTPPPAALRAAAALLFGRVATLEVQVVPCPAHGHDAVALALAEAAAGRHVTGGPSRWLAAPGPTFSPTWRVLPEDLPDALPWIASLPARGDVTAVRVVPVDPIGLEGGGPFLDPAWLWLGRRWFVRWRDGARDRDAMVLTRDRPLQPPDAPALRALTDALQRVPGLGAESAPRPVSDSTGRHGYAIHLPARLPAWGLSWTLGALGAADVPATSTAVDLALPRSGASIVMWRAASEQGEPVWGSVG